MLLDTMIEAYSAAAGSSRNFEASTCENPTTELSGVRTSWDMFWMKSLFMRLARSALSLASRSSSPAATR